ncbi:MULTISPECIES: helix-turn-helix domain-containing protein [unclassified Lysinibacillus]|uniref:helix-turn-helix domain-containing protein n=1 Tax=unclassified Lysinibacillus TaxID=2636778 RepID=UPI00380EA370
MKTFGDKMKVLRESKGWTQKYTSEKMEVSPQMYNNYEKNKTNPSLEILKRVCDLYNIYLDTLDGNYDNASDFLRSVELDNSYFEKQEDVEKNTPQEEYPYFIPNIAGLGYNSLFNADLYNNQIDYEENEFFFFENTDIDYSPGRLKEDDLLYCEGINPKKEPKATSIYLIHLKSEDKYYLRNFLDQKLVLGIIKGLKGTPQEELLQNIPESNLLKDFYFLMPNLSKLTNMSIVNKSEVKIIGELQYVIYNPQVDLFESLGFNYKELAQKQWDDGVIEFRKKVANIIQEKENSSKKTESRK